MPLYDNSGRLGSDLGAIDQRDAASRAAAAYALTSLKREPSEALKTALSYRAMHASDGHGLPAAEVDGDSRMRLTAESTHSRTRLQLSTRVFTAAPDLSRGNRGSGAGDGRAGADDLAMLVGALRQKPCDSLSERDYDRFSPGVCTVGVEHIVPPWTAGGASSREIARSSRFQRALGRSERAAGGWPVPEPADERSVAAPMPISDASAQAAAEGATSGDRAWRRLFRVGAGSVSQA